MNIFENTWNIGCIVHRGIAKGFKFGLLLGLFGQVLGHFGSILGQLRVSFGPIFDHFRCILGRFWMNSG